MSFTVAVAARRPAAFCVVLDRSGSMEGRPLEHALTATRTAIKNLRKEDHFALVVFDDAAQVVVPLAVAKAKTAWRNAVNAIKDGGGTNLTAGWMLGRDELAKAPDGFNRRLLLLTDGQLNVGIVDPAQVQGIAASGLERQGIRTSCLGFGDGYNETLLGALAKDTNGDFHDADSPEKLPAIFAHELDGLQALAVQNLRVRLKRLDFCEQVFGLNDYPFVTLPDGRTEIAIGDLGSEEERVAVFALEVLPLPLLNGQPVASLEGEALLEVELAWDEISATGIASKTWSQIVRVQATQNPAEVKANETVLSWVAVQRAAKAVREASAGAAAGDEAGARHQLDEEIKLMESAGDAPVVREALGTLREAQAQLNSAENSSRKGKLMFSLSSGVSRQSSRRRPAGRPTPLATQREPRELMWILTTVVFFSIVQKPRQTGLTIRARVAADLDRLRGTSPTQISRARWRAGRVTNVSGPTRRCGACCRNWRARLRDGRFRGYCRL